MMISECVILCRNKKGVLPVAMLKYSLHESGFFRSSSMYVCFMVVVPPQTRGVIPVNWLRNGYLPYRNDSNQLDCVQLVIVQIRNYLLPLVYSIQLSSC